jgi:hypothetical protein
MTKFIKKHPWLLFQEGIMTKFIKKHPWLLFKCIALTSWFCGFLAKHLTKAMLLLLDLKNKDPNPPPPPAPREPSFEDQMQTTAQKGNLFSVATRERPKFNFPYIPEWVAKSFKDHTKHPLHNVKLKPPSFLPMASKPAPEAPLAPTVALETTLEVGRAAIDNLRQAVSNIEKAVELPPTRKLKKSSKKG